MASKQHLHVLIVDCDEYTAAVTTSMLERLGYTSQSETQSLTALRTFSEDPDKFDFAVIEPVMPHLSGPELARRFRRIRRGFPVLFYTGYLEPSLIAGLETAGLGETIFKPLGLRELGKAVEEGLSRVSQ